MFQTRVTTPQDETAPLQQQPQAGASGGDDNIYDELYEMEEGGNNEGGREAATGTTRPRTSARNSGVPTYYVGDPGH